MFWPQVTAFVLINLLFVGMIWTGLPQAQHSGTGAGAYSVWQLIAHLETEQRPPHQHRWLEPHWPDEDPDAVPPDEDDEPTGRHHLRKPNA